MRFRCIRHIVTGAQAETEMSSEHPEDRQAADERQQLLCTDSSGRRSADAARTRVAAAGELSSGGGLQPVRSTFCA